MKLNIVQILICAIFIPALIGIASAATPAIDIKLEVSLDQGANWYHSTDSATAPLAMPGTEVWWRGTITNVGDVELTDVEVIGSYGASASWYSLAPGSSTDLYFHIPSEKGLVSNTETATGYYGDTVVTDSDTAYYSGYNAMPSTTLFADNTLIEDPVKDSRWYTDDVLVELVAHDPDDPDSTLVTNYELDDGGWRQYTGPFIVSGDGVHTLEFHSVDPLGKAGSPLIWTCTIDATLPYVASTYPADDATDVPADATITGIWNEPTQTTFIPVVMITVDGTALYDMSCSYLAESFAIQPHSALPAGKVVTVSIFGAVDVAGNKQTDPYTWSFTTGAANPQIAIDVVTNGADGQDILAGSPITWRYTVTNPGDVPLGNVVVADDTGVIPVYVSGEMNGNGYLDLTETWIFEAWGTASEGLNGNTGTVSGTYDTTTVTASDTSSYFGFVPDTTPPVITISTPFEGAVYTLGQPVLASWSVTDDESGVASSTGTVPSGEAIDTGTVGEKTFTVTATDNAGNAVTETVTYSVVYACTPLTPSCTKVTQVKQGSTMPVKLVLKDNDGSLITGAVVKLYLAKQSGTGWGDEIAATSVSAPKDRNVFRYNPVAGQYMYNLNTKVLSTGTWQLMIKLDDGTIHTMTMTIK